MLYSVWHSCRQDLPIHHTVDIMHAEKNVTDNILWTIMGEKDFVGVRQDTKDLGIRKHLWMQRVEKKFWVSYVAPLSHMCCAAMRRRYLCRVFTSNLRVPTGYGSTFKKHVETWEVWIIEITWLPYSHASSVANGHLWFLHPAVHAGIIRLSTMLQKLGPKVVEATKFPWWRSFTIETCPMLEAWLPPS